MNKKINSLKPLVSVLMPAYNAESFIADSIQSIKKQSYDHWELIILDDCSTDGTLAIALAKAADDARISVLQNPINAGISKSRNRLIETAAGEYIAWQDADDYSYHERLQSQVAFMEAHPEVGMCGGTLDFFDGESIVSQRAYPQRDAEIREKIFRQSPVAQPVAMIRASVLRKAGKFDENLAQAEDLDLSFRIGQIAKFANLNKPLLRYRYFAQSVTRSKLSENIRSTITVRLRAYRSYHYPMSLIDKSVLMITWLFIFMPGWITYPLFNLLRNSK